MVDCCQRCRALLPVSQFFGIQVAAEQRPSRTHTPPVQPTSVQASSPLPSHHIPATQASEWGKDLVQRWYVQHRNWAALFVKPFVFFRSSLLSLLPCVAPLCMVPSPWDPWPHRENSLLGHHVTASRVAGAGTATFTQQSRDVTARAARRGMPTSGWVGGSPAATQPQGCASWGGYSRSKGSGWGTIPACGSSPGDAEGRVSRRRQRSEEPL